MAQALIQMLIDAAVITDQHTETLVVRKLTDKTPYPCRIRYVSPMPPDGDICVYALIDPRNGDVFYVGQTKLFLTRMRAHLQVNWGKNRLDRAKMDIADSGNEIFVTVIATANSQEQADRLEMLAIKVFWNTIQNTVTQKWQRVPLY